MLTLKVDVDTEIGTRIGVPNLLAMFKELAIPATFYLSLGPDNTGRAIKRVFRRGFLQKVSRTSVVSTYGIRTLLNGVLLPGPHIGKKHQKLLATIKQSGFDVGIHAYDHQKWQDGVTKMTLEEIEIELQKAVNEFKRIFEQDPITTAAPGWQANAKTLTALDRAQIEYASDCRGREPFFPRIEGKVFHALQLPTTLPTLDELLGRPEFPVEKLTAHYLSLIKDASYNVLTLHAELEGMKYKDWFKNFLIELKNRKMEFNTFAALAHELLKKHDKIPVCDLVQTEVEGRSGVVATQG